MNLSYYHQLCQIKYPWQCFCSHDRIRSDHNSACVLQGPKACGKTRLALKFLENHPKHIYFSFSDLSSDTAIKLFLKQIGDSENNNTITDWKSTFDYAVPYLKKGRYVLVFDDVDSFVGNTEFLSALSEFMNDKNSPWIFVMLLVRNIECLHGTGVVYYPIKLTYRSIADIAKAFPEISNKDVLRLYTLSGGIPAILDLYDAEKSFEDNLSDWLRYDSKYFTFFTELLKDEFRTPETYLSILYSIANGNHRISEIGDDLAFPYNKCDKYIHSLMHIGLVTATQKEGSKRSEYHITNSYTKFWLRELYHNRNILTPNADCNFIVSIMERLDEQYTFPCYKKACIRFMREFYSYEFPRKFSKLQEKNGEPLTVKLSENEDFTFDFTSREGKYMLFVKIQSDFETCQNKDTLLKTMDASEKEHVFYDSILLVFGINRFSDYCVHTASTLENLKLIPITQLKY